MRRLIPALLVVFAVSAIQNGRRLFHDEPRQPQSASTAASDAITR